MYILFITLIDFTSLKDHGIYTDLLNEFILHGHQISVVSPIEKRNKIKTHLINEKSHQILKVKIGNIQKTNMLEKGISMILLECNIMRAIKKYFSETKFDLIISTTPPITLNNVIKFMKKRNHAEFYLLLKDIFPQNAVDLKLFRKHSLIYGYFRKKEKQLYRIADYIGCMSEANVTYILKHNWFVKEEQIEVCPNSISLPERKPVMNKPELRQKFKLPVDQIIFLYGGNLGKPQGVDFLIECLIKNENLKDRHFVICGKGTDFKKLEDYIKKRRPNHVTLINGLSIMEYDELVKACDIGLVFLDYRFTIPNFPSRILAYMKYSLPIIACTDKNTDLGDIIARNRFGYWCISNNSDQFTSLVDHFTSGNADINAMGALSYEFLKNNYTSNLSYHIIMSHFL